MAKGVHNATSGYRRGLGKNGGGLPGQPSGKKKGVNRKKLALGFAAAGLAAGGAYVAYKSKGGNPRESASNLGRIASEKLNAKNAAFARTPSRGSRTDYVKFFGASPNGRGKNDLTYAPGTAGWNYGLRNTEISKIDRQIKRASARAMAGYTRTPKTELRRKARLAQRGPIKTGARSYKDVRWGS